MRQHIAILLFIYCDFNFCAFLGLFGTGFVGVSEKRVSPLGESAAKPPLLGLGPRRLFFLKLTPMVRFQTAPTGPGGPKLDEKPRTEWL